MLNHFIRFQFDNENNKTNGIAKVAVLLNSIFVTIEIRFLLLHVSLPFYTFRFPFPSPNAFKRKSNKIGYPLLVLTEYLSPMMVI